MPDFQYAFTVDAPQSAVAKFHEDTSALRKLSPPPIFAQLHNIEPLAEGSVSEFTLWFGPFPARWRAVHSGVSASGFTDTQEAGPLQSWQHQHQFVAIDENRTEVRESIEYEHPAGFRGLLTRLVFSKPGLWGLFTYRKLATRQALSAPASRPKWALPALFVAGLAGAALLVGYWLNRS
jgi:ligand-binding SRPBCC domain-containing protein